MTAARVAVTAVVVTYLHLVFGGIVRITGSGMGCGDHWPKCNGSWIPPFTDLTVMIEWTHRLLALLVILSILWLVGAARTRAADPGVSGAGGVSRPAVVALVLVVSVALLGMVTVKLAKGRWRIYEVPISYSGRTYAEGKKIGLKDAFEALWVLIKYSWLDTTPVPMRSITATVPHEASVASTLPAFPEESKR